MILVAQNVSGGAASSKKLRHLAKGLLQKYIEDNAPRQVNKIKIQNENVVFILFLLVIPMKLPRPLSLCLFLSLKLFFF